jgi:hypothetical protein
MKNTQTIPIFLYGARGWMLELPPERRDAEARRAVKMLVLPRQPNATMSDSEVPDALVTPDMAERYLELDPPFATVNQEFQAIVAEIDYTYVHGAFFSTVSASCVTIERILNLARIALHPYCPKIKNLWSKGPSNEWYENIDALMSWGYLHPDFANELRTIYREIRCRYLHSGEIKNLAADALRSARAAYRVLELFVGFPTDLFTFVEGRLTCTNVTDPRYVALCLPHIAPPS